MQILVAKSATNICAIPWKTTVQYRHKQKQNNILWEELGISGRNAVWTLQLLFLHLLVNLLLEASILWRLKDLHGIKRALSFSTKLRILIHCVSWCKHSNSCSVKILRKRQKNSNSQHAQHTLNDQITFWQVSMILTGSMNFMVYVTSLQTKQNCLNHSCTSPK